ncbi:MAG: hypothetical protein WCD89_04930 [Anaerocolumna sp.]
MKLINRLLTVMSIIMLCLIAGNVLMLSNMKSVIETGSAVSDWMSMAVAVSLIVVGLFHLLGIISLIRQFRYFRNDNFMRAAAFVIGFLSLFLLASDVTMLSDIGNEYLSGHDTSGEWRMVFAEHFIHALFAVLLLIQCVASSRLLSENSKTTTAVKDEALFLTVNQIGIISAILGLICLYLLNWSQVPQTCQSGLLFLLYILFLIPYVLTAACWFFTKRKERPSEWYDEKQFTDVSRGAFFTLIITVLITIVFYFLSSFKIVNTGTALWFPEYLFLTLLLFSGSTLYLSKKA